MDAVEDHGIRVNKAVDVISKTDLLSIVREVGGNAPAIVDALTLGPRRSWKSLPSGFRDKDRQPWRFRRRLSLLRRPLLQISDSASPSYVIAPALLRDALAYSILGYHDGSFPHEQLKTKAMKAWAGEVANARGRRFTEQVARRMEKLGWQTEKEVTVRSILKKRGEKDLGDVDVLAWSAATGRILIMECKDLHVHKSPGEVAEQLRDFRGHVDSGKRDLLRRHLDRCELLKTRTKELAARTKIGCDPRIEGWVVFKNPVPMLFAWNDVTDNVQMKTYSELDRI